MEHRLRANVRVDIGRVGVTIVDGDTGLCVSLDANPFNGQADQHQDAWYHLGALGMLDEGLSLEQVRVRQEQARKNALEEDRLARLHEMLSFVCDSVPFYRERANNYAASLVGR